MVRKIKVVHMTTVHHPDDPRIYYKQCRSLADDERFEVTLIAQKRDKKHDKTKDKVNHVEVPTYQSRLKRIIFGSRKMYQKAKKLNADIYVFHDPELLYIGKKLKHKNNVVIYDIHEDYVTSIQQKTYLNKLLRKIIAKVYKKIEKHCTKEMALSLAEKYYQEIYPDGKCILNYPIIDRQLAKSDKKHHRKKTGLLYTGNVTEDRGALTHAKIPKLNDNISVQMIGKCSGDLADKMFAAVGEEASRLDIEGIDKFIVKDQIDEMYQKNGWLAGLALFPPTEHYMRKELTKFFEYMSHGIPVLCSNFPLWRAFVEEHECGIVADPSDEASIKAAIHFLETHPEEVKKFGENGRKAVQNTLNWQHESEEMIAWYQQLIKEL